jgi:hypothetical protein
MELIKARTASAPIADSAAAGSRGWDIVAESGERLETRPTADQGSGKITR